MQRIEIRLVLLLVVLLLSSACDKPESGQRIEGQPSATAIKTTNAESLGIEKIFSKPAGVHFQKTETTVGQFLACARTGVCKPQHFKTKNDFPQCNIGHKEKADHPANCISWYAADAFCRYIGGRLPSDEEWLAEASDKGQRTFPWGDEAPSCDTAVWSAEADGEKRGSQAVCSHKGGNSVSGLCDMAGNVYEWTGTKRNDVYTLRGGSFIDCNAEDLKTDTFLLRFADDWYFNSGFRCVFDK